MRVLGAVLAGGRSSRFGSDKAAADWGGRTLADHAAAAIAARVDTTVLVGPGGIDDLPRAGLGPLGGIAAALDHAARNDYDSVLTIACDMPRLPDGLIDALLRRVPAYCVEAPVLGHWSAALCAPLLAHLDDAADRSVLRWARAVGALPIVAGVRIANVNTREDLMAL
ncbi:molybdenum cofactor guanylyltransferase [Sphingomonas sp.]|uniref:molybdenum cofactor guanylyltransferase n=1 Tax=Sphingomonas sp. TaxID=28214 RepID=UPI0035BC6631